MPVRPNEKGQGIIEYILIFILALLVLWIVYTLLSPAISKWIQDFLSGI